MLRNYELELRFTVRGQYKIVFKTAFRIAFQAVNMVHAQEILKLYDENLRVEIRKYVKENFTDEKIRILTTLFFIEELIK